MDIAVIVSTYERPGNLVRCLASLEAQEGVEGRFEVVVTDDGSRDATLRLLAEAVRRVPFPLRFTTHVHDGFRLARCRNEGVAASQAPYLLFTDGDCILPPDHLRIHLESRRAGRVVAGDSIRLDAAASDLIDAESLRSGRFPRQFPIDERWRLLGKGIRAKLYEGLRVPGRPRLTGNNIGVWRTDLERVNGFDEQFVGWGLEDRDVQVRLERLGLRTWSLVLRTTAVHLWHPPVASFVRNSVGTDNLATFRGIEDRPTFCLDGLRKLGYRPTMRTVREATDPSSGDARAETGTGKGLRLCRSPDREVTGPICRLLTPAAFSAVFEPLLGRRVGYVRPEGNVGDRMIEIAMIQLFREYGICWQRVSPGKGEEIAGLDMLVFGGGGNMGTRYRGNYALRTQALATGLPVVILPQSFTDSEDRPFAKVFVRERGSLALRPDAVLAPDLALGLATAAPGRPDRDLGVFLRRDQERRGRKPLVTPDPARLVQDPWAYLALAARHRRIVTDRLHFAVAGLHAGREVTIVANDYHKNRSMYETWLADLGCRFAATPTEAVGRRAA